MKTRAAAEKVFAPKVAGTLVLEDALRGQSLDFFVNFSSLVSVLGGAGQVDYCAASSFQDAWAQSVPPSTAALAMSIDWGAWREVGKAFRAAVERGASAETALRDGMSPAEGIDALNRALAARQPQILVSPGGLPRAPSAVRPALGGAEREPQPDRRAEQPGAPPVLLDDQAPRNDRERVIARLWEEVLGVPRVGIDDNFFDLGGDSMVSLQFIAKAKKAGLRFTNRQVFEHQTVAELAAVAVPLGDQGGSTE